MDANLSINTYVLLKNVRELDRSKSRERMGLDPNTYDISTRIPDFNCNSRSELIELKKSEKLKNLIESSQNNFKSSQIKFLERESQNFYTPEPGKTYKKILKIRKKQDFSKLFTNFNKSKIDYPKFSDHKHKILNKFGTGINCKEHNALDIYKKIEKSKKAEKSIPEKINSINHWETDKYFIEDSYQLKKPKLPKDINPIPSNLKKKSAEKPIEKPIEKPAEKPAEKIKEIKTPTNQIPRSSSAYIRTVRSSGFKFQ
jgi:hypothetical protein